MSSNEVELNGLNYKITATAPDSKTSSDLSDFAESVKKLKNATKNFDGSKLVETLNGIAKALGNVNIAKITDLERTVTALNDLKKVKIPDSIAEGIKGINDTISAIDPANIEKLERFSRAIKNMDGVKLNGFKKAAKEMSNAASETTALQKMADAKVGPAIPMEGATGVNVENPPAVAEYYRTLDEMTADIAAGIEAENERIRAAISDQNVRDMLDGISAAANTARNDLLALGAVLLGLTVRFAKAEIAGLKFGMAIGAKQFAMVRNFTSAIGNLVRQIGRMAFLRTIRSILMGVQDSLGNSTKALYEYSNAMGTLYAPSMDSLATSANYLSNSLAAMTAPIVNALAPAIDFLIDKIVVLLNWFNQLFAAISGAAVTTIAKKTATTFGGIGSSAGKAGSGAKKAAKELKRFILAFDEINALGSQSDGSGSGGSGGGSGGSGGLGDYAFEEMAVGSQFTDFANQLKALIEGHDWESLGILLAQKINYAIVHAPWAETGRKLGEALNGVIQTAYFFLENVNFLVLGSKLAEFFNNAFSSVKWEYLGRLLVRGITSVFDTLLGFFLNLDYGELATGIHDFIKGALDEAREWLSEKDWSGIGRKIATGLADFIRGLHVLDLIMAFADFIREALSAGVKLVFSLGSSLLEGALGDFGKNIAEKIAEAIKAFFSPETWKDILGLENTGGILPGFTPKPTSEGGRSPIQTGTGWFVQYLQDALRGIGTGETGGSVIGAIAQLVRGLNKSSKTIEDAAALFEDSSANITAEISPSFEEAEERFAALKTETATKIIFGYLTESFTGGKHQYDSIVDKTAEIDFGVRQNENVQKAKEYYDSLQNKTATVDVLANMNESAVKKVKDAVSGISGKSVNVNLTGSVANSFWSMKSTRDGISGKDVTINLKGNASGFNSTYAQVLNKINYLISQGQKINAGKKALGGAFYGGSWHDIPQYARGTLNAGSMFVAGEAGPELVGHIGGRTEVLNASQIASAMYAAVTSGMAQFVPAWNTLNENVIAGANAIIAANVAAAQMEADDPSNVMGDFNAYTNEQNALLREQNDLLRDIASKDFTTEITTTSLTSAFNRKNQRDGKTIIPVGT